MGTNLRSDHPYPGRLIIVEGIDGSGKSTQLQLLNKWLLNANYRAFFTEWNSAALVKGTIRRGKKKNLLTPTTFSILHATDFADRLTHLIIPPLKAGMIVLADRYVYTAFARDVVRGVHPEWVRNLYGFAVKPNLAFYFKVPIEVSLGRILIEGTDGVGRSTQIEDIRRWLEIKGYGVITTGWTRSPLMSKTINEAKSGHTLNIHTFSLLYAADLADRLENEIIPALKAGFI